MPSTAESTESTTAAPAPAAPSILDAYVLTSPSDQNALDVFKGEWTSKFPPPYDQLSAGGIPLFQDGRIAWALKELGGVGGQSVLELGPLEGGHSYMLQQAGASSVLAIEANSRAYLKCLIVKEILKLQRVQFACGNFMPFLEANETQYDFVLATGVLYHMKDPVRLLQLIAKCTSRVSIWTHYYDETIIKNSWYLSRRFLSESETAVDGKTIKLYRHDYNDSLDAKTYCGGSAEYSTWLSRADLLGLLEHLGFTKMAIGYDTPDHPHGPSLAIVASKG